MFILTAPNIYIRNLKNSQLIMVCIYSGATAQNDIRFTGVTTWQFNDV